MGKRTKRLERKLLRLQRDLAVSEYRCFQASTAEDAAWHMRDQWWVKYEDARAWAAAWKRAAKDRRRRCLNQQVSLESRGRQREELFQRIATLEKLLRRWMAIPADITSHDHGLRLETDIALGEAASIDADSAALTRAMAETTEVTPLGDMLDEAAVCSVHGCQMQHVRPGKWQCEQCDVERFGAGEGQ